MHAGYHDKDTLMAATIAEFLYPAAQNRRDGEAYNTFIARIKALYHKEVLAPLRRCLDVPEVQHPKLSVLSCRRSCADLHSLALSLVPCIMVPNTVKASHVHVEN